MRSHIDPLANPERMGRPVVISVTAHVALFAFVLVWAALNVPFRFGEQTGTMGGAVAVMPVEGIPLPTRKAEIQNPLANPVEHDVPAPLEKPEPAEKIEPPDDRPEIPIEKERPKKQVVQPKSIAQKTAPKKEENQLRSTTGARVSDPLYTGQQKDTGAGVGFGAGTQLGEGYGWYAQALQRRLSEEWRKTLGQSRGVAAKPAIVMFRISYDGSVSNIEVTESSGNSIVDFSAQRAVSNSNPLPRLPPGLRRRSIDVEMWFRLQ